MTRRLRYRWHALRRMSWAERGGATRAFLALTGVRLTLTVLGFRRTHALLARQVDRRVVLPPASPGLPVQPAVAATARAVDRAARLGPRRASCLPRALTLWWLLRRQGLAAEICIGTRRAAGRLEAHAWVECDGCVLNDRADVRDHFAAFDGPIPPLGTAPGMISAPAPGAARPLEVSGR